MKRLNDFKTPEQMGFKDLPWEARLVPDGFDDEWEVNVTSPIFTHMTVIDGTTAKIANIMAAAPDMYIEGLKLLKQKCGDCVDFKSSDKCQNCNSCIYGGLRVAIEKAQDFESENDEEEGGAK